MESYNALLSWRFEIPSHLFIIARTKKSGVVEYELDWQTVARARPAAPILDQNRRSQKSQTEKIYAATSNFDGSMT